MKISERTQNSILGIAVAVGLVAAVVIAAVLTDKQDAAPAAAPAPTVTVTATPAPAPAPTADATALRCMWAAQALDDLYRESNATLLDPMVLDAFNGRVSSTDSYLSAAEGFALRYDDIRTGHLSICLAGG